MHGEITTFVTSVGLRLTREQVHEFDEISRAVLELYLDKVAKQSTVSFDTMAVIVTKRDAAVEACADIGMHMLRLFDSTAQTLN